MKILQNQRIFFLVNNARLPNFVLTQSVRRCHAEIEFWPICPQTIFKVSCIVRLYFSKILTRISKPCTWSMLSAFFNRIKSNWTLMSSKAFQSWIWALEIYPINEWKSTRRFLRITQYWSPQYAKAFFLIISKYGVITCDHSSKRAEPKLHIWRRQPIKKSVKTQQRNNHKQQP